MTLNQLRIIATLVDNQLNISASADKLFRVQSALSNQLRLLEEELGDKLFERRGKRLVSPTSLCKTLLPEIKRALLAENNIKALALDHTNTRKGDLRIATTHTQARYFLPGAIHEFRNKYPEVRLSIYQSSPAEFLNMLRGNKIDFAIFADEKELPADFTKIRCYEWNRVLILRREHPLGNKPLSLERIANHPIITYMPGFAERSLVEQTFNAAGVPINVAFSAGDTDVIKTYVRLDLGVGIVAQMARTETRGEDADEDLVFLDLSHLFENSTTYVVHLKALAMRVYMNEFTELLRRHGQTFQSQLT